MNRDKKELQSSLGGFTFLWQVGLFIQVIRIN